MATEQDIVVKKAKIDNIVLETISIQTK